MEEVNSEEYQIVNNEIGLDSVVVDLISDEVINEFDKRLKKKIIYQLESLKYYCATVTKDSINNMWKKDIEALDLAIEIIKNQETEKEKWIPVSERLPENGQRCLVTTKGMLGDIYCEITTYSNNLYKIDKFDFCDKKNVSGFYNYDIEYGFYEDADVIAWMPLPEPYKSEREVEQ